MFKKFMFAALVVGTVGLAATQTSLTQGQDAKEKKARGRLPPYYGDIVTEQQRQKIYDVQAKYDRQIDSLREQLEALQQKRDTEIEGLLTADQKEKLKKAQEEGAAKRKKSAGDKADKSSPADEAKPAAPAETKKVKTKQEAKPK